ncbi:hypothetical protein [Limnoglobus roseus]|uniref:Uncharacterized protein n=1 Tax=Limnoglobus roseus TaxID=2598579 RepID=A0A5C1ASD9_9BACT|nr:hypothetical protein [Limnoglobus roseus]QEL20956.1 hypothetical protein PX52LOC_08084 [Limnoglobus roseus]
MTDKSTPLILDALTRAAAERSGVPLHASKTEAGLFPNTAAGKAAAKRCRDDQMLQTLPADPKSKPREVCTITERGLQHLMQQVSPKKVLEDFVRILEERRGQVDELLADVSRMAQNLDGLKAAVAAALPDVTTARVPVPGPVNRLTEADHAAAPRTNGSVATLVAKTTVTDVAAAIQTHLSDWAAEAARDCPLPELYQAISCGHAGCSVGLFHDALRQLHTAGRVYLHPWTGPLYAVPEPTFALLVGHNVAYYASAR